MGEHAELIARLEKATEPDRELDLAILNALRSDGTWVFHDPHKMTVINDQYGAGAPGNPICSLERFTASIEDALSAGEPSWEYSISTLYGIAHVEIPLNDSRIDPVALHRKHGHVPTALLEAIMTARAALNPQERRGG